VGLDAATGESRWAETSEAASYSSPTLLPSKLLPTKDDLSAIVITRLNVVRVDIADGKATSLFRFGSPGPTVNAAMPLVIDDKLFITASYSIGAACYRLTRDAAKPEKLWASDDAISSQYSTPVHHEGFLYGIHGREDIPPAHLRCVDLATGKVMWSADDFGVAHPILAGDKLLLLTVDGELVLAEASPRAYKELGRVRIATGVTRALPALSSGRLYCRTGEKLLSVEVAKDE
jgi:outer membrane protein assembly factor BamB